MFKKPKRNFRGRQRDSESDDENQSANAKEDVKNKATASTDINRHTDSQSQTTIVGNKKKEKPVPKVPSANAILSFEQEEDGDGEVFQVKKPTHSKRIVKQLKKETLKEKIEPQIKQEANKSPKLEHLNGNNTVQIKIEGRTEDFIVNNEAELDEFEDDDELSDSHNSKSDRSVQDFLKSGQIPDANMIHLVRKRRQMARELGDDFIAVDDTVRYEKKSSRLIRDDDNDASDSEEDNLALTAQQKEIERRRMEERILAAEEEHLSDTSEHEREWEEQQIRKGVSIPAQPAVSAVQATGMDSYYYGSYQPYVYGTSVLPASSSTSSLMAYGMESVAMRGMCFPDLPTEAQPISLEISKQKLMDRLSEMMDVHRLHVHERDEMGSRRELNQEAISNLTGQTRGLEEQYKFFQEMRGYVRDLVECMNEKMSSIVYLDRCMMNMWKDRAMKLVKRHQDDVKDQSLEYTPGKVSAAIPLITTEGPEEHARNRRRADREGRRNRRKHKREAQGLRDHFDGLSTDDEFSISEITKFKAEHDRLINDSSTAFDDVMEDFYQIPLIKQRFETWKNDYSDSYNEAYIGLCLTKLFTPLVKLELVTWNPLEPNCVNIERSNWFRSLVFYGCKDPSFCPDDSDIKLVPSIIDKVLFPRLTALVEVVWNPLSFQSTLRLVKVISHLHDDYPTVIPDSKNLQAFVKAVKERIKKTLDDDIFMPLYPKQVIENRTSGSAMFFFRQLWLCIKLLKSIVLWNGILPTRQLRQFAFDSLLNRYLVVALPNVPLGTEFLSICQAVVAAVPKEWFAACKGDSTLPQLENFCRCLVNSAISSATNNEARDSIRQISKMLVSVQANNHATSLASRLNFKILE